jgi:hypothetical protein
VETIKKQQIKSIYALGASLNMLERDNHDDALHQLVEGITEKSSVAALTYKEGNEVIAELIQRMKFSHLPPAPPKKRKPKKCEEVPGGMTEGQQRKVWSLMYELKKFDSQPSVATLGERLCGIIKRQFNIDAMAQKPFQFLRREDGNKLIEILKSYCGNAETRHIRGESG